MSATIQRVREVKQAQTSKGIRNAVFCKNKICITDDNFESGDYVVFWEKLPKESVPLFYFGERCDTKQSTCFVAPLKMLFKWSNFFQEKFEIGQDVLEYLDFGQ